VPKKFENKTQTPIVAVQRKCTVYALDPGVGLERIIQVFPSKKQ
jgi:hypothetical protein